MNKCQHGSKINYFCATDCCVWREASGCQICIRKYHNHMGTTVFLNQDDINLILKKFTPDSSSKPKCRILQQAIYAYFSAIKSQISNSIDLVCKDLIYQIGYPYLNSVNSLSTYRRLKNKEYRKLAQKDFKGFYELALKLNDKQLASQQSKIYLKQLNTVSQLINLLQDIFKQFEIAVKRYHNNFVHNNQPADKVKQILRSLNISQSGKSNSKQFKTIDNLFSFARDQPQDNSKHYKTEEKKPFQLHKNVMPVLASADRPNYSRDLSIDCKIVKQPRFGGFVQIVQKQRSQKQIAPPKQNFLERQKSQKVEHTRREMMNKRQIQINEKKKILMEMMKKKQEIDSINSGQKKLNESITESFGIGKQKLKSSLIVNKEKSLTSSYEWNLTAKKQSNILMLPSLKEGPISLTNSLKISQKRNLVTQRLTINLNKSQTLTKEQLQKSLQKNKIKIENQQMVMLIQQTKSIGFQKQNLSDKSEKGSDEQSSPELQEQNDKVNNDINYAFTQLPVEQKPPKGLKLGQRVANKLIVIPTIGLQKDSKDQISSPILKKKNILDRYKETLKVKENILQNETSEKLKNQQKSLNQSESCELSHRKTESQLQLKQNEQISLALLLKSLALKAEQAVVYLQKAIVYAQNNLSAAEYLSFLYLQLDRPLDCLKLCNKTMQKIENSNQPDDLSLIINNNKATALNILGRYSESIVLLQKCLKHREKDYFYKNLGDAYFSISINQKAIYSYEKALRMNDQLDEAHYNLAVCLFGQLDYNNALLSIKKAIDLYPTNMQYHELHKNIVTRINNY